MENLASTPYRLFRLTGPDAWDFGQRMFSRNISGLSIGEGALAVFLTAEAKINAVFWVVKEESGLALVVQETLESQLRGLIEKYHFAENFELKGTSQQSALAYSEANDGTETRGKLLGAGRFVGFWRGAKLVFTQVVGTPKEADAESWLRFRIEHLIPEFPLDFNDQTLVFDPGFEEICDADKGCYIGQEIVERVRSRGAHYPRELVALKFSEGLSPVEPKATLLDPAGSPVGSLSSSLSKASEKDDRTLALAYLKSGLGKVGSRVAVSGNAALTAEVFRSFKN